MKIRCLLALAAVASMARGMTEDNDEPQQRRLNQLGASFGDAADLLSTYRPGGGASLTVGRSQEDENAVPGVFRQLGEGFGNAAASLRNGGLGGLVALATSSQQNEASEEPEAKKLCVRPGTDAACEAEEEAEEEEAFRQKARIDESGCDGFVVQFPTQKMDKISGSNSTKIRARTVLRVIWSRPKTAASRSSTRRARRWPGTTCAGRLNRSSSKGVRRLERS